MRFPGRIAWRALCFSVLVLSLLSLSFSGWRKATSQPATAPSSGQHSVERGLPNLRGAEAIAQLKQQGLYASLGEAMAAARYAVFPVEGARLKEAGEQFYLHNPAQRYRAFFSPAQVRLEMSEDCSAGADSGRCD